MEKEKVENGIRLGYEKQNLNIDCLNFADDLALLSDSLETAAVQIRQLETQAAKVEQKQNS